MLRLRSGFCSKASNTTGSIPCGPGALVVVILVTISPPRSAAMPWLRMVSELATELPSGLSDRSTLATCTPVTVTL